MTAWRVFYIWKGAVKGRRIWSLGDTKRRGPSHVACHTTQQGAFIVQFPNMSLFQFGVSVIRREQQETEVQDEIEISESHLPPREDTNLGTVEYRKAASASALGSTSP